MPKRATMTKPLQRQRRRGLIGHERNVLEGWSICHLIIGDGMDYIIIVVMSV